nr:hypothetical protein [Bacilli bacterium]
MASEQDLILDELEKITENVTQALVDHDTKSLSELVVQQVQWAKKLQAYDKILINKERIVGLISRVQTQQLLAQQALSVSDFFLEKMMEARAFNQMG